MNARRICRSKHVETMLPLLFSLFYVFCFHVAYPLDSLWHFTLVNVTSLICRWNSYNKMRLSPNAMFDYQNDQPPETLGECGGCVPRHGLATEWWSVRWTSPIIGKDSIFTSMIIYDLPCMYIYYIYTIYVYIYIIYWMFSVLYLRYRYLWYMHVYIYAVLYPDFM